MVVLLHMLSSGAAWLGQAAAMVGGVVLMLGIAFLLLYVGSMNDECARFGECG